MAIWYSKHAVAKYNVFSGLSPTPPPLTSPAPHPGDLLLACETARVNKFPPDASSTPLHTSNLARGEFLFQPVSFVNGPASRSQTRKRRWVNGGGGRGQAGREEGMLWSPLVPTSLKPNKNGRSFISFPAKP